MSVKLSIGIDIGADSIKLICLKQTKAQPQLIAHAVIGKDQMHSLREFLAHSELKQAELRVAIQDPNLKIQKLTIPIVPPEEMDQVVSWALRDAANIAIEDFVVRFLPNKKRGEDQTQKVTAFAMTKAQLAEWLKFIAEAKIEFPDVAEPDIQSLANTVAFGYDIKESDRFALIDIGKSQSQLAILSTDGIEFFRPFSGVGSEQLASNLSHELNMSPEEAEKCILQVGSDVPCERQDEVMEIVSRYCAKFCVQTQYAVDSYSAEARDNPITNILLSGGGAKLKGLKEQIQESLHLPTDPIDPFARLDLGTFKRADFEDFKTIYAVAAGLAL